VSFSLSQLAHLKLLQALASLGGIETDVVVASSSGSSRREM
jgi:hypothetical protein